MQIVVCLNFHWLFKCLMKSIMRYLFCTSYPVLKSCGEESSWSSIMHHNPNQHYMQVHIFKFQGGVLRFELDMGVPLEPQNPYPSLKVILAKKGTHFLRFSFKNMLIFQKFRDFRGFHMAKTPTITNLGLSQKSWPMFKDFLGKKRDPCLRISCKKATH